MGGNLDKWKKSYNRIFILCPTLLTKSPRTQISKWTKQRIIQLCAILGMLIITYMLEKISASYFRAHIKHKLISVRPRPTAGEQTWLLPNSATVGSGIHMLSLSYYKWDKRSPFVWVIKATQAVIQTCHQLSESICHISSLYSSSLP